MAIIVSKGDDVKVKVEVGDTVSVSWNNTANQRYKGKTYYIVDETGLFGKVSK